MKVYVVIFVALFALCSADEDCSEERVTSCLDSLLSTLLGDSSEEEVCSELRDVTNCLKSAADDCLGDDRESEVDEGLQQLEDLLKDRCPSGAVERSEDDDDSCLQENKDYVMECMSKGAADTLSLFENAINVDVNAVRCTAYSVISHCVVERAEEKCGKEVSDALKTEFADPPEEITEACTAAGDIELTDFESLFEKK